MHVFGWGVSTSFKSAARHCINKKKNKSRFWNRRSLVIHCNASLSMTICWMSWYAVSNSHVPVCNLRRCFVTQWTLSRHREGMHRHTATHLHVTPAYSLYKHAVTEFFKCDSPPYITSDFFLKHDILWVVHLNVNIFIFKSCVTVLVMIACYWLGFGTDKVLLHESGPFYLG